MLGSQQGPALRPEVYRLQLELELGTFAAP